MLNPEYPSDRRKMRGQFREPSQVIMCKRCTRGEKEKKSQLERQRGMHECMLEKDTKLEGWFY
jgi:hypothetical protein